MNVPRDQMNPNAGSGGVDHHYQAMTVTIYSNAPMSEADLFRGVVNQVVARNGLTVDRELLNRYIDQRIQSGDMLKRGQDDLSGMLEPWTLKNGKKGFKVGVDSDFQETIAAFAKSPVETLKEMAPPKDPGEKPAEQGSQTGNANAPGNGVPGGGASTQPTPGATGKTSSDASGNPSETNYDVPPGKTLSEVAGGRGSQPIDVTLSKLASSAYDDDKYGPPPPGWRAIDNNDVAKRLGVSPDDPKVSEWFRQFLGGKYALEGDQTKQHEFKAQVFTDDKGNFVLSYRGTAEGRNDWKDNNFRQGVGLTTDGSSDKFSGTAVSTAQEFVRMFGQYDASGKPINLAMVGHSQGGGLATMGSLATGVPAVTFDASGIHPNTLARINTTPDQARKYAENGGIRAYSLSDDALTNLQENSILGPLAPDALGTKIRVPPAKGKGGRLMEEYGEVEIGLSNTTRKVIDNSGPALFFGTVYLLGPGAFVVANAPNSLISHSPKALTDALTDRKPWEKGVPPIVTPRPTPTPTPDSQTTVDNTSPPKVVPVPQPHPTPTPKKPPDQNEQWQSVVRSPDNSESAPSFPGVAAARSMPKAANEQTLLDDPTHPRNAMFRQAMGPINARDNELGRGTDDTSLRLAAGMTADARARGLETIRFAQFSPDGRRFFMADTLDPSLPWARTAVGDVGQALQQSVGDSTLRVAQSDQAQALARQHAQPTQQQNLNQNLNQDGPVIQGPRRV